MKKTILICLTMVLVLMVGSSAIAGGKGQGQKKTACLVDPPANLVCLIDFSDETVSCSWDALPGAKKYAFEIVFEVPLLADPTATQEVHFHAGTIDTNIIVTFAELQAVLDPFDATLPGQPATAKVKGLNPPQKGACSQANAFAETALDFTAPVR